jgi:DNA-binding GntR family transcriptional regulator
VRRVHNPTLADRAYQQVETLIVTLNLAPGTVFSETDLSQEIGIGRTPLREALLRLTADGLVSSIPRRGMRVSAIDLVEVLNIIETRKALDRIITEGAAKRASEDQRAVIKEAASALAETPDEASAEHFMAADYQLDRAIWAAAPNQCAVEASRPLHSHCRRLWFRYHGADDLKHSAELHANVVEAILEGAVEEAGARSDRLLDYLTLFTKHILIAA